MKKILSTLLLFLTINSAFASSNWQEFTTKTYYDKNSIEVQNMQVSVWLKLLKGSALLPENHYTRLKDFWYSMIRVKFNCANSTVTISNPYFYATNNNLIHYDLDYSVTGTFPPDSIGALLLNGFCPLASEAGAE